MRRSPRASRRSKRARDSSTTRSTRRRRTVRAAATRPRRSSPSAPWQALLRGASRATRRSTSRRAATLRRSHSCSRGSAAPPSSRDACISTSRRAAPLRRPPLSGAVVGEGLRIDAPQYGLHFTNGRLAAHAANDRIVVDDLTLGAGAGTFHASGEVSGLTPGGAKPVARLAWRAEKFRVFNRPDLHLVVGGEGSAVAENGRVTLTGKLRADEGSIVYLATPDSTLGDDVVVKGWDRPSANRMRVDDLPLVVDLMFDLGDRLTFSGEGIDTRLAGAVRVTTGPSGFLGKGSIRTVRGTYLAFGQELTIERGPARIRRPPRQPGARHRRAAQEPRRRGRRRRHRDREGAGHPAHVESRPCRTARSSPGSCWGKAPTAPEAAISRRCRPPPRRSRRARQADLRVDRAEHRSRQHHDQERGAERAAGHAGRRESGRRRRQANLRPPVARLRAGAHRSRPTRCGSSTSSLAR